MIDARAMNESYANLGYPTISNRDEWKKVLGTSWGEFGIIQRSTPNDAIEEMKNRLQREGREIFAMYFEIR